ncbi:MAG TPA: hypothetical protein VIQ79_24275 [Kribbella sp.]
MTRLWAAVRRQPVRSYLYGVLVPGEALAVSYGLVSGNQGALWLALGAAVLVVPAAEAARARVTPTADPHDDAGRQLVARRAGGPVGGLPAPYDFRPQP